jgi:anti-sigma regulatory factor (Ser/Thr protein kinase)
MRAVRPDGLPGPVAGDHWAVTELDDRTPPAQWLRLRCPAALAELRTVRRRVQRWACGNGLPDDVVIDLQLAVGEAVSNGIEHAYVSDGPRRDAAAAVEVELELRARRDGPVVAARVSDRGRWRPAPADPGYRGRGLALIQQLSREMRVRRTTQGTEVTFAIPAS